MQIVRIAAISLSILIGVLLPGRLRAQTDASSAPPAAAITPEMAGALNRDFVFSTTAHNPQTGDDWNIVSNVYFSGCDITRVGRINDKSTTYTVSLAKLDLDSFKVMTASNVTPPLYFFTFSTIDNAKSVRVSSADGTVENASVFQLMASSMDKGNDGVAYVKEAIRSCSAS